MGWAAGQPRYPVLPSVVMRATAKITRLLLHYILVASPFPLPTATSISIITLLLQCIETGLLASSACPQIREINISTRNEYANQEQQSAGTLLFLVGIFISRLQSISKNG